MDDYPAQIADFLETTARRIRAMTVDRVRGVAKWTALGLILAVMSILIVVFLLIGIFRLLGELIGMEWAYAAVGGLFLLVGALLWSRRIPKVTEDE